jgi:hypothetical protein
MIRQIQEILVGLVGLEVPSTTEDIHRISPIASEFLQFVGVQQRGRKKQTRMDSERPTVPW